MDCGSDQDKEKKRPFLPPLLLTPMDCGSDQDKEKRTASDATPASSCSIFLHRRFSSAISIPLTRSRSLKLFLPTTDRLFNDFFAWSRCRPMILAAFVDVSPMLYPSITSTGPRHVHSTLQHPQISSTALIFGPDFPVQRTLSAAPTNSLLPSFGVAFTDSSDTSRDGRRGTLLKTLAFVVSRNPFPEGHSAFKINLDFTHHQSNQAISISIISTVPNKRLKSECLHG
jgi:hypothetical protein